MPLTTRRPVKKQPTTGSSSKLVSYVEDADEDSGSSMEGVESTRRYAVSEAAAAPREERSDKDESNREETRTSTRKFVTYVEDADDDLESSPEGIQSTRRYAVSEAPVHPKGQPNTSRARTGTSSTKFVSYVEDAEEDSGSSMGGLESTRRYAVSEALRRPSRPRRAHRRSSTRNATGYTSSSEGLALERVIERKPEGESPAKGKAPVRRSNYSDLEFGSSAGSVSRSISRSRSRSKSRSTIRSGSVSVISLTPSQSRSQIHTPISRPASIPRPTARSRYESWIPPVQLPAPPLRYTPSLEDRLKARFVRKSRPAQRPDSRHSNRSWQSIRGPRVHYRRPTQTVHQPAPDSQSLKSEIIPDYSDHSEDYHYSSSEPDLYDWDSVDGDHELSRYTGPQRDDAMVADSRAEGPKKHSVPRTSYDPGFYGPGYYDPRYYNQGYFSGNPFAPFNYIPPPTGQGDVPPAHGLNQRFYSPPEPNTAPDAPLLLEDAKSLPPMLVEDSPIGRYTTITVTATGPISPTDPIASAWRKQQSSLPHYPETATEIHVIHSSEHFINSNGRSNVTLVSLPESPNQAEERTPTTQMTWLHVKRKSLSLELLERLVLHCPPEIMPYDLKQVALSLLEQGCANIKCRLESGKEVLEPGSVLCYRGTYAEDALKGTEPVIFVSAPFFLLKEPKGRSALVEDFESMSLLQSLYGYDIREGRENTRHMTMMNGFGSKIIHVPELWCLLVGSSILVTFADCDLKEIRDDSISIDKKISIAGGFCLIRVMDADGEEFKIVIERDCSFWKLTTQISLFAKRKYSDITQLELLVEDDTSLDGEAWVRLMSDAPHEMLLFIRPKDEDQLGSKPQSMVLYDPYYGNNSTHYGQQHLWDGGMAHKLWPEAPYAGYHNNPFAPNGWSQRQGGYEVPRGYGIQRYDDLPSTVPPDIMGDVETTSKIKLLIAPSGSRSSLVPERANSDKGEPATTVEEQKASDCNNRVGKLKTEGKVLNDEALAQTMQLFHFGSETTDFSQSVDEKDDSDSASLSDCSATTEVSSTAFVTTSKADEKPEDVNTQDKFLSANMANNSEEEMPKRNSTSSKTPTEDAVVKPEKRWVRIDAPHRGLSRSPSISVKESRSNSPLESIKVSKPSFFQWGISGHEETASISAGSSTLSRLLKKISVDLSSRDVVGKLYSRGYECSLTEFEQKHHRWINGSEASTDSQNDADNITMFGALSEEHSGNFTNGEGPSTLLSDSVEELIKNEMQVVLYNAQTQDPPDSESQIQIKVDTKKMFMLSKELLALFVPSDLELILPIMQRYWGAIDRIFRQIKYAAEMADSAEEQEWTIRPFAHSHHGWEQEESPRPLNISYEECHSCSNGHAYMSAKHAVAHIHEDHTDCPGLKKNKAPFDDPCYVWLEPIHKCYNEQHYIEITDIVQEFLSCIEHLVSKGKQLQIMVASVDGESGSKELPPLPDSLVLAFEDIVMAHVIKAKQLSLRNQWFREVDGLKSYNPPDSICLKIEDVIRRGDRCFRRANIFLDRALTDIMLVKTLPVTGVNINLDSIGVEFLVAVIIGNLQARSLDADSQTKALLDRYRNCTAKLQFQANRNPKRKVFLEIQALQEELEALQKVLKTQKKMLEDYRQVTSPNMFPITTIERRKLFPIESKYIESIRQRIEKYEAELGMLRKRLQVLREQVKQSIEILEEGHGKAIRVFTIVTLFFLPLSFISSVFGMNTADVRDMDKTIGFFWLIALPVTLIVIAVAFLYGYKWDSLTERLGRRLQDYAKRRMVEIPRPVDRGDFQMTPSSTFNVGISRGHEMEDNDKVTAWSYMRDAADAEISRRRKPKRQPTHKSIGE